MSEPWRTWMPLDIGRYLTNTGHLSTLEHGAYLLLIMHHWTTGSLPQDDRKLAAIAKLTPRQWSGVRDTIAAFFRPDWSHKTVEEQLHLAEERYFKRANAGRTGGLTRAQHEKDRRDHHSQTEAKPNQSSSNATAGLGESSSNATAGLQQNDSRAQALTHTHTSSNEEVWVSVRQRVTEAFVRSGNTFVPDTSWVGTWKSRDYDPEICLSVVQSGLQRNNNVRALKYFDQPIADAHVAPKGRARASPASPRRKPSHISVIQDDYGHGSAHHETDSDDRTDGGNAGRIAS